MKRHAWNVPRIRSRHRGYRNMLLLELLIIWLVPLAQHHAVLIDLSAVVLLLFFMNFTAHLTVLRSGQRLVFVLGACAIAVQLLWAVLRLWPELLPFIPSGGAALGGLALLRLILMMLFFGNTLVRMVRGLIREPFVTASVLMGAAAGYVQIGLLGGALLNTIHTLHPTSFIPLHPPADAALTMASLGFLTTASSAVLAPNDLVGQAAAFSITIVGQLYVAILIALVLGRFHRRMAR